jgi:predicted nucleic-acid-binding protein
MKITVDTNVLVRSVVRDDKKQAIVAEKLFREFEIVVVPLACLCELVWVLDSVYGFSRVEILGAVEALEQAPNIALDRTAVEAGMAVLRNGADFADGVIAHEGKWLGGDLFASFDKKAVNALSRLGHRTRLLS